MITLLIIYVIVLWFVNFVTPIPSFQDNAICGLVASTNIGSLTGYSKWACSNFGNTSSNPCSPVWPGVSCSSGYVSNITLISLALRGIDIDLECFKNYHYSYRNYSSFLGDVEYNYFVFNIYYVIEWYSIWLCF